MLCGTGHALEEGNEIVKEADQCESEISWEELNVLALSNNIQIR